MGVAAQVIVVEARDAARERLVRYLADSGFRVTGDADAAALPSLLRDAPPDLVLLALDHLDPDALALLRMVRRRAPRTGVIVIGPADARSLLARVLDAGADDALAGPYDLRELRARVRGVLRRIALANFPASLRPVRVGRCLFDPLRRELRAEGGAAPLDGTDAALLRAFAANPLRPLEPGWLAQIAALPAAPIAPRIAALRERVEHDPAHPETIRDVAGIGYMFVPG